MKEYGPYFPPLSSATLLRLLCVSIERASSFRTINIHPEMSIQTTLKLLTSSFRAKLQARMRVSSNPSDQRGPMVSDYQSSRYSRSYLSRLHAEASV
jgi:hypothetical protein